MSTIRAIHDNISEVVVVVGFIAGTWALAAHFRENLRTKFLWTVQHTFHLLIAVQVALGAILVGFSDVDASGIHMFYGFLTFIGVGIIISYRHLSEYKYLLYGVGGLFVMGLAIRAMTLNPIAAVG